MRMTMSKLKEMGYDSVAAFNAKHKTKQQIVKTYNGTLILLKNAIDLHDKSYAYKRDKELVCLRSGLIALKKDTVRCARNQYYLAKEADLKPCFVTGKLYDKRDMYLAYVDGTTKKKYIFNGTFGVYSVSDGYETKIFLSIAVAKLHGYEVCVSCGSLTSLLPNAYRCACYRQNITGYHSYPRKMLSSQQYRFGMEVEKEDYKVRDTIFHKPFYKKTWWALESDSSLGEGGFEAVSPVLGLFDDAQIAQHFKWAKHILNAKYSGRCGGHIHVSDVNRNPERLFDDCAGYFPLLYALYPKRSGRSYSTADKKDSMKQQRHVAVHLTSSTVEFRIFPSPKNIATQWWRIKLLRIMVMNKRCKVADVIDDMLNVESELFKHLATQHKTLATYLPKVRLTIQYARSIEGLPIEESEYAERMTGLAVTGNGVLVETEPPTTRDHNESREVEQDREGEEMPDELMAIVTID